MQIYWVLPLLFTAQALRLAELPTVQHSKLKGGGYEPDSPLYQTQAQNDDYSPSVYRSTHWPKYPVLAWCDSHIAEVLRRDGSVLYEDYKFWVGLVLWVTVWVMWFCLGRDDSHDARHTSFLARSCWALGLNLIILSIMQYAADPLTGVIRVCWLLVLQSLAQSYLRWGSDDSVSNAKEITVDTMYMDLGAPLLQISFLLCAQVGVWFFYITSIQGNVNMEKMSYLFWLWSYITMQMTMIFDRGPNSVLGSPFPTSQWYSMVVAGRMITYVTESGHKIQLSRPSICIRGILGFFCNTILRDIMSFTIPLMLMHFSEPMDFVVYCVGVNFICTVDDMSETKYKIE